MKRRAFLATLFTPFVAAARPLEPDLPTDPYELTRWRNAPRLPRDCAFGHVMALPLMRAINEGGKLRVRYDGGEHPGSHRIITPAGVYQVEGWPHYYVDAWCHETEAHRTFRVDRMRWPVG